MHVHGGVDVEAAKESERARGSRTFGHAFSIFEKAAPSYIMRHRTAGNEEKRNSSHYWPILPPRILMGVMLSGDLHDIRARCLKYLAAYLQTLSRRVAD